MGFAHQSEEGNQAQLVPADQAPPQTVLLETLYITPSYNVDKPKEAKNESLIEEKPDQKKKHKKSKKTAYFITQKEDGAAE